MPDTDVNPNAARRAGREVAEAMLRYLQTEMNEGRLDVYRNVFDRPFIIFQAEGAPKGSHYLHSDVVRGWLAVVAWNENIGLLREREIDRILIVLSGHALKSSRPQVEDVALLDVLRSVPVVVVVYEFVFGNQTPTWERKMGELYRDLRKFAQERGMLSLGRKRFPGGPNWLSHELNHYKAVLAALGIDVEIGRSNGCNVRLTKRSDGSSPQSSKESSGDNAWNDNRLQAQDAKSEQLARLRAKKAGQQKIESEGSQ